MAILIFPAKIVRNTVKLVTFCEVAHTVSQGVKLMTSQEWEHKT